MSEKKTKKESWSIRFLSSLEQKCNKMWDPITIFFVLCGIVMILSWVLSAMNVTATHPGTGEALSPVNLLSMESLQNFFGNIPANYRNFPPMAMVLVIMLGAGVAEKSGLIATFLNKTISKASPNLVTFIIVFAGINAVAVGDAGYIVLPPLAAAVYMGMGRNPLAGIFTAYASVTAGFAASVFVQMGDVLVTGFTVSAAQLIDPYFYASPAINWYFMIASTFMLGIVGTWVNNKVIEPRLGTYKNTDNLQAEEVVITAQENRALRWAGISLLIVGAIVVGLCIGPNAFFRDPATGSLITMNAPLMRGLVPLVMIIFLVPGLVYGILAKTIRSDRDVATMMGASLAELSGFLVLAFFASQFVAMFADSNMGAILSIAGAEGLQRLGVQGPVLILGLFIISALINLFIGSASAKWAIMAPIFVPMFMLLGFDPALTQIVYRIGDSVTNVLTPMFPYFPILVGFVRKYQKDAGYGTILANMIPFSLAFAAMWLVLLAIWVIFRIPLGPGGGIFL